MERQITLQNAIIRFDYMDGLWGTLDKAFCLQFLKRSLDVHYIIYIDLWMYTTLSTLTYVGYFLK